MVLIWLFLEGIAGCKALQHLSLSNCTSLASVPEGGLHISMSEQQLFRMVQLLSESFGDANYAVLVAGLGECTQLKELILWDCSNLKLLPDSE